MNLIGYIDKSTAFGGSVPGFEASRLVTASGVCGTVDAFT